MTKTTDLNTKEDTIRVRRVRISDRASQMLEQIVRRYECTYNQKLSLSGLLSQIADGRLKVIRPELPIPQPIIPNVPLIELNIEVYSNLNGTLAEIAKKIATCKANIYRAKAVENSRNSQIKILLSIPKNYSLVKLIESLYEIKVEDIFKFNEEKNLEKLLEVIGPIESNIYKASKKKGKNIKIKEFFENTAGHKTKKLITNITCTIGFQLVIDNKPGTLDKLTHKIAEKRIFINSISIDFNANENINILNIYLGFCPSINELPKKIDSIEKYIKSLKTLNFVKKVKQLSIDYQH